MEKKMHKKTDLTCVCVGMCVICVEPVRVRKDTVIYFCNANMFKWFRDLCTKSDDFTFVEA